MVFRLSKRVLGIIIPLLVGSGLVPTGGFAQRPPPGPPVGGRDSVEPGPGARISSRGRLVVYVRELDGSPIAQLAIVMVSMITQQYVRQVTTAGGSATFDGVRAGRYNVQVIAPGYEKANEEVDIEGPNAIVNISVRQSSSAVAVSSVPPGPPILAPKAQKELGKALEALRANKPADARAHLEAAYHLAPGHPDVNFLFGIYCAQTNDWPRAKAYWDKAVNIYPRHLHALLSLSEALLREDNAPEAMPYLNRAIEVEPSSWRAHMLLADGELRQRSTKEAIRQAERAIELGHGQAAGARLLLARAFLAEGDTDRASKALDAYLRERPSDSAAQKLLESLYPPEPLKAGPVVPGPQPTQPLAPAPAAALPLPSTWLPPDVDEKVPRVEPGVACPLEEVLQNASKRVQEFVSNVDRFTATESLKHEVISAWGLPSSPETRKFDYLVSIREVRPGFLDVEEYRDGTIALDKFPAGIATLGLPSLVLAFHSAMLGNYEVTCEGLAESNGGLAWQVHFRQRPDKPNTLRSYRVGGQSTSIPLKGRAWIAADTFQVVRIETDLVAPHPEIRLTGEHTAIEYGPVHFVKRNVDMWLPQTAEVFFDLRGRRIHRRHSFSNYLLFSVDDRQRITLPKEDALPTDSAADASKPKQ